MGKKVGSEKISREDGYIYYLGKDGYVWAAPMKSNNAADVIPPAISVPQPKASVGIAAMRFRALATGVPSTTLS